MQLKTGKCCCAWQQQSILRVNIVISYSTTRHGPHVRGAYDAETSVTSRVGPSDSMSRGKTGAYGVQIPVTVWQPLNLYIKLVLLLLLLLLQRVGER